MAHRLSGYLWARLFFILFISTASAENDRDFKFCGTWRHGNNSLSVNADLSPGCKRILISANKTSLSVKGQITAQCTHGPKEIPLKRSEHGSAGQSNFCLYWEPLFDQLVLQVGQEKHTLCWHAGLQGSCCTDLSHSQNGAQDTYGIFSATIKDDVINHKTMTEYSFYGETIDCKNTFCAEVMQGPTQVNMVEETVMKSQAVGNVELPCARSSVVEMKDGFQGYNVTLPAHDGAPPESVPSVHLPGALKIAAKTNSKVVCTFFRNTTLFQDGPNDVTILNDVVGITVENQVITNLIEPVRIGFHHDVIPKTHFLKCVSWDTRKDPLKVNWLEKGCLTQQRGSKHTECLCNHLTYFTILVQLEPQSEPKPVRHLLALTAITSLGCLVSAISCVALIVFLCKKRRLQEQSIPIHMGLAVSLLLLNLLFFFTGILANVGGERLCVWVGAGLHYCLLSSLCWMGIQIFHTFWLVYIVFTPQPKPYIWNLIGFVLPAVPIIVLSAVGNIYGLRKVVPSDDVDNPYLMCWMKSTNEAILAHYFTNMALLAILVSSGAVMLFLVYREIRNRDEWRQNRVAFLSIWGLSCLFGTSWGLTFLDFGPLSEFFLFLSCILNSFQGFLLMLRFWLLGWMRKQSSGSSLGSSSTGSTRQHMLQAQEKN
ncbi:adhesion G-protein coupled receptor G1-like [Genypterus blacodes]|uniref:adhesion G-protein coupled receptor G1-like n=1 Tax=Genypterus blacodes TaxID=154954 RepID=UPI003F76FAF6